MAIAGTGERAEPAPRERRRSRLTPQARRTQLIELGVEMLAKRTLDDLSVEDIAAQAGISRGLLFHYFASKQEFHVEVARAAAARMLERTAPDPSLTPVAALRAGLAAFIDYVEENPDNYQALVRGAASGDPHLRAISDDTRTQMAQRILDVIGSLGLQLDPLADLAVHGWVVFVEECVVRWLGARDVPRDDLLEFFTKSLPAVAIAATATDVPSLIALLTAEQAIGGATAGPEGARTT